MYYFDLQKNDSFEITDPLMCCIHSASFGHMYGWYDESPWTGVQNEVPQGDRCVARIYLFSYFRRCLGIATVKVVATVNTETRGRCLTFGFWTVGATLVV